MHSDDVREFNDAEAGERFTLYTLEFHKTADAIGPKQIPLYGMAHAIVQRRLGLLASWHLYEQGRSGYLFSPREDASAPYRRGMLQQAVRRACDAAIKAGALEPEERWRLNQIRHHCATHLRATRDMETAQAGLWHTDARTTAIYAEPDRRKHVEAQRVLGGLAI